MTTPTEEPTLDKNNPESIYNWLCFKISSPGFRNIMKDFIDDNCNIFIDVDENTFQQGQLFNEFNQLLENLLSDLLVEGGLTQEQFLLAAEKGLSDEKYKKYFDQILNLSDYNYFKKVMTKRNYQLIKRVEEQMAQAKKEIEMKKEQEMKKKIQIENQKKGIIKTDKEIEEDKNRKLLNQLLYKEEEEDLQRAIQQSLQSEQEKKKIQIIEDEELKRAIKQSLLDSVRAQPQNNEKEKEVKKEEKKEEKPIAPKKQEFKIEKNNMFNFSEEVPVKPMNTPLTEDELEPKKEKPFKPSYIISASKGSEFQIEGKKTEFGISNPTQPKKTEFQIDPKKNDFEFSAPKNPNPYAHPAQAPAPIPSQPKQIVKIENTHKTEELIDDTPIIKKEKKDYSPTLIEIEKKKQENKEKKDIIVENKNDIKKENKKTFDLLQFEENPKDENIVVAKEIKTEKASDIIKNTLNQNKIDNENDDGGLLIDEDEGEDVNNYNQNAPKTNTFIDKKKDINLGKVRIGKDGGNFLNNFSGMKNYEKGGIEKMENRIKGDQFKSVIDNPNEDEDYQNKLKEVEKEKQEKLKEYREFLLKIKKEKRENKAKEVLSPEELAKLESKKRLAEQLKAKRK